MKKIILTVCVIIAFGYTSRSIGSPISTGRPLKSKLINLTSSKINLTAFKSLGNGWYTATIDGILLTYWDNDNYLTMSWSEPWVELFLNDELWWWSDPYGSGGGGLARGPIKLQNNTNYTFRFRRPGVSDKTVVFPVTYWEPEIPPTN